MQWKSISLEDRSFLKKYFRKKSYPISDYNFTHLFIWCDTFHIRYCLEKDFLIISGIDPLSAEPFVYMPLGLGEASVILQMLWADYHAKKQPFLLRGISPVMVSELYPSLNAFDWHYGAERDEYEYIYLMDHFKDYMSTPLRRKREACKAFESQYDYSFKPYESSERLSVQTMIETWYNHHEVSEDLIIKGEHKGILKVLDVYEALDCEGFVLRVNEEVVGFILAEKLNEDILVVHIEKANRHYKAAYDLMKRELARYYTGQFKYISLEEDMGIDGLRKAKNMYRPDFLIEKGFIIIQTDGGGVQHG